MASDSASNVTNRSFFYFSVPLPRAQTLPIKLALLGNRARFESYCSIFNSQHLPCITYTSLFCCDDNNKSDTIASASASAITQRKKCSVLSNCFTLACLHSGEHLPYLPNKRARNIPPIPLEQEYILFSVTTKHWRTTWERLDADDAEHQTRGAWKESSDAIALSS